ncbi:MAG: glutathione S-transferase family protein [Rhodospirillaceae bacterium]|jgi:GST-like protein|nr:glutathione S-transferase family protein [Rhodospirillaceae bacterium]MBT5940512.1 glutathione S-transferase family protein [Rhodospirillaceae bacterium]MBT7268117.1 glutathione S-transferase family protein [Rhodospirillaceae bacterium]
MIDLYTWKTDNGFKALHGFEESGVEYTLKPVNLQEKEQFDPDYMKISPAHKIPAIIDHDGPGGETVSLCESGAILKYIATKAGGGLYPSDPLQQAKVDQWLFFGSAQFTTLAQQYGFYMVRNPEDVPAGKEHYTTVLTEMFSILDKHLGDTEFMAGDFSIADISIYSDTRIYGDDKWIGLADYPSLKRWHDVISGRPAAERAWSAFE